MTGAEFLQAIVDPRGRVSRKGFIVASAVLIGLEILGALLIYGAGLAADGVLIMALKCAFVWVALVACVKRLHDLGYSGWWLAIFSIIQVMWTAILVSAMVAAIGIEQLQSGSLWSNAMYAGAFMPLIGAAIWIQLARGEARINPYGFEPDGLGFGMAERGPLFKGAAPTPQN
ncbi:MAG: DUF805 domain-containing protein [Beijerinckiaceae bacterium]